MERSPILTVPRVASILGISIPYAQRLLREGKIPGVKTPNGWCATQEAVEVKFPPKSGVEEKDVYLSRGNRK